MIRAVILAAGTGSRLRPLTDDRPKALVEVAGEPLLLRLARQLAAVSVSELIVATGHAEEAVVRALARIPHLRTSICRNDAFATTQNVVSLHVCAPALLDGGPRETWKLDGDLLLDDRVVERLAEVPLGADELLCAVDRRDDLGDEEMKVSLDGARVLAFGKGLAPRGAAESAGIERIGAAAVSSLVHAVGRAVTAGETQLYYEDVYDRLVRERMVRATAVDVSDLGWTEIDTHDDLSRAEALARGR